MILMKDIVREHHPILTKIAKPIDIPLLPNLKKLLLDLREFLINSQDPELAKQYKLRPGVGIALPQVGKSLRGFVTYFYDFNGILYDHIIINPILKSHSEEIIYIPNGEGCLSIDRATTGVTPRYHTTTFSFLKYEPQANILVPCEITVKGYASIVFQHEFDHLEGILFINKLFESLPNAKSFLDDKEN